MANSKEKYTPKQPGNIADDLDSMLDDAASSTTDAEGLMGDDDAIDQLLKDNSLEPRSPSAENEDELEDLFSDDSMAFDLDDEFGPELEPARQEFKTDEPKSNAGTSVPDSEVDEFAEIDEFADESVPEQNQDDGDFTVAEFDISYDDSASNEADSIASKEEISIETTAEPVTATVREQMGKTAGAAAVDAAIAAQISQLFDDQAALKKQLNEISTPATTDHDDEIKHIAKAQKALKNQFDKVSGKHTIITYAALGLAIVAVLMTGLLAYSSWDKNVDVEEMSQRVVALEDNQKAIIEKNYDKEFDKVNAMIGQQNQAVNDLTAQLTTLTGVGPDEKTPSPLTALNTELSSAISQQKTLNDSIAALDDRIKRLETKTPAAAPKKRASKTSKKPAIQTWSVNLVSFRQEWYANRKAAEFAKKGIPVDVTAVQVKGEPWYRLTVKGFKSKAEASAYADRVKKNLNLDSVWLDKD